MSPSRKQSGKVMDERNTPAMTAPPESNTCTLRLDRRRGSIFQVHESGVSIPLSCPLTSPYVVHPVQVISPFLLRCDVYNSARGFGAQLSTRHFHFYPLFYPPTPSCEIINLEKTQPPKACHRAPSYTRHRKGQGARTRWNVGLSCHHKRTRPRTIVGLAGYSERCRARATRHTAWTRHLIR